MNYRDQTTDTLLVLCDARMRNDDPVPVDLITALGERGIVCASRLSDREVVYLRNETVTD